MRIRVIDELLYERELLEGFLPKYSFDAGLDLRASEDAEVLPGVIQEIGLGVAIELPPGTMGFITGRSTSALKMGLFIMNGLIDAGYRGEIHAHALTIGGRSVDIARGDRLAQIIVVNIVPAEMWRTAVELSGSERDEAGLGSTGRR